VSLPSRAKACTRSREHPQRVVLLAPVPRDLRPDTDLDAIVADLSEALAVRASVSVEHVMTPSDIVQVVERRRPDVVFNACETLEGRSDGEPLVPALLQRMGVPFTGNPARCLRLCLHKARASVVLRHAGVRVPATFEHGANVRFPVIVKPASEDGSVGIHAGSVVHDDAGLARAIAELGRPIDENGSVDVAPLRRPIVQEYIEGREIAVSLLGWPRARVLSPGEILYDERTFADRARILTYASKWDPASPDFGATQAVAAELDPALLETLSEAALRAMAALGMRDYGRIDFRVDRDGRAFVIDANPNCDLARDAGFMRAAQRSGFTYEATIWAILEGALARRRGASTEHATT